MLSWILVGVFVLPNGAVTKVNPIQFANQAQCLAAKEMTDARLIEAGAPLDGTGWATLCIQVEVEGA